MSFDFAAGVQKQHGQTFTIRVKMRMGGNVQSPIIGGFLGMNLFFGPLLVFLPLFARAAYGGTIGTLASLETSLGAGTALGGVFLSLVRFDSKAGAKICLGMGLMAVSYVGFRSEEHTSELQ